MKFGRIIFICFILTLSLTLAEIRADNEATIDFERFSDRVLIVKTGKVYFDQVIAIASERGLVLIDTGIAPSLTTEYRKIIEREFGRNDFTYVINTHYHFDHTSGNQVFPEAEIISHERCPEGMRQFNEGRQNFIASRRTRMAQLENQLKNLEPNSTAAQRLRDLLTTNKIMIDDLKNNYVLTLPTITFSDRMTLDLGDLKLNLIYFGEGRHTGDDIIIHCPEEKLLFTGDLFFRGSMLIAFSAQFDAPRWIEVLNKVLKNMNQVEWVYDAHNGRMPGKFIALWRDYLVDVWESLIAAKEEGLSFEAVQERFSYDEKFKYLEESGLEEEQLRRDHQQSLLFVWRCVSEIQSAATVLEQIISESGIEPALNKYQEMYSIGKEKYYFDETEFNRLGYRLLQGNKVSEAIEIFKLNVKMYPDSWNVYDSLGEAYMNAGEMELAIKNYEKSLEINPQNTNAIIMLKRIKKEKQNY
jgi:glyoxylase-like metal-dependent hydrolase (beta-lactamase superfamily II)